MKDSNIFFGTFYYTYIESGFNEEDFKKVYDDSMRSVNCTLKLPDEMGNYLVEMEFETPDKKHKNLISSNLKNIVLNGSDSLYLGIHFKSHELVNKKAIIHGDFILEIKEELDGYHFFKCSLEFEDLAVINQIEKIIELQ